MTDPVKDLSEAVIAAAESLGGEPAKAPTLERPPQADLGDYSTNAAMMLAGALKQPPRAIAERLGEALEGALGDGVERVEVAGPGFLNLFMADDWLKSAAAAALGDGDEFGRSVVEAPERVNLEFVSANPTGPITVAAGRHAAYGDSLARVLELAGSEVDREYYVNDYGGQVQRFGASIRARALGEAPPEDGYQGEYVKEVAAGIEGAGELDVEELAKRGVAIMLEGVEATLRRFRVEMDRFSSERELQEGGAVEAAIERLREQGHVYESEGATWLRSTEFGDDKDRVLRRSNGEKTYFAADIAYHEDKRGRGYDHVVDVLGADHHGYLGRMRAAWQALGGDPQRLEQVTMQLVNLLEDGQRAQMSKRGGQFVTLDELVDDIGVDATRWFLVQRSPDTALDLDLDLARQRSQDNPVYYAQYAHARIASILRRAAEGQVAAAVAGDLAVSREVLHPSARDLVKKLLELPEEVRIAADRRAPHRMAVYVTEVAQSFSAFYRDCKVIGAAEEGGDEDLRLALCELTRRVIARSLDLLGVEAPDEM
ncbi:MAG TPA: arginine--tRNA ligase [Thermoleophilaceae bacterium]|nr:arginine--tRNA ligase [Thermoleophilaceae bacterium]